MVKHILVCTWGYFPDAVGGAERQARLQTAEFQRRGYRVEVVCPQSEFSVRHVDGVRVWRLPIVKRRPWRTISYCLSLSVFLICRMRRYDQVFVHQAFLHSDIAVVLGTLFRRPVWVKVAVSGPHGEIARQRRWAVVTRYVGLRKATVAQAISEPIVAELESIGVPNGRIRRIPNGYDAALFQPVLRTTRQARRIELGLPASAVQLLFVGRFARHKGLDVLLHAWSRVGTANSNLILLGAVMPFDPYKGSLIQRGVILRDWTRDPRPYYEAADIFVLPSRFEGMSNALLEAMASGLACIATRVGAAEEMIRHGHDGLLVPPNDVEALADNLRLLIGDSVTRQRIGAEAARSSASRYGINRVVTSIIDACPNIADPTT